MTTADVTRSSELCRLGVAELARAYRDGSLSPVDVTRATLERIDALNPRLNAFRTVLHESALAAAAAAERQLRAGIDLGPMHGVPVSTKDIIRIRGTITTAGSRHLIDAPVDQEDAAVVERLRRVGAILVGKVNLHEFALGAPDPDGPYGLVQNPRRVGYQPGSSSSGSGSATAAGLGVMSLGTDTGGSIRGPAALNGIVGLKPTYGRVSVRGCLPLSVSLDHIGPLARSVADVAASLAAIAGHDPKDPHSAFAPTADYLAAIGRDVKGLRIGVPTNELYLSSQPEIRANVDLARSKLADLGATLVELELPRLEEAVEQAQTIMLSETCAYHEAYRDDEELYQEDFKKSAFPGREISAIRYVQARQAQAEIRREWLRLFEERIDVIAAVSHAAVAPPHGTFEIDIAGEVMHHRPASSRFSRIFNLTGFPAMTMPTGRGKDDMPTGIQLIGPPFAEARLFAVGHALESALGLAWVRDIEPVG